MSEKKKARYELRKLYHAQTQPSMVTWNGYIDWEEYQDWLEDKVILFQKSMKSLIIDNNALDLSEDKLKELILKFGGPNER